jgi:hypothetical protein
MSYEGVRLPLSAESTRLVPDTAGVFVLWDGQRPLYIGMATQHLPLRQMLQAAVEAALPVQKTKTATAFSFEVPRDMPDRYAELRRMLDLARPGKAPRSTGPR